MKPWILAFAFAALSIGVYLCVELTTADPPSARPGAASAAMGSVKASRPAVLPWSQGERPALVEGKQDGLVEAKAGEARTTSRSVPTSEEMRDHIQASFAADPSVSPSQDPTPDLEKRVRAVIPAGSVVRSLECRSSLCRVETMHPGLEEFRDFVQRAYLTPEPTRVSNGPVLAALLAAPVDGQPVVAVAFLGREGAVLPMPIAMPMPAPDDPAGQP